MALLYCDSFDTYATADILQTWNQLAGAPDISPTIGAFGRRSSNGARWTSTFGPDAGKTLLKNLVPSDDTFIGGFAFKADLVGFTAYDTGTSDDPDESNGTPVILYIRKLGVTHVWFRVNTTGTISAYRSTTVLGTTSLALNLGVTTYIEVKVLLHASAGTVDIRFNGASVLSLTGLDTQNGGTVGWDEFGIGHISIGVNDTTTWDYDDLYVCDGSGGVNDDFLGDVAITPIYPNGTGTHSDGTPSTGADQYAVVDETPMNGDTDYNTLAAVADRDSFAFPNAPVASATILGVQVRTQARLDSGGTAGLKAMTRIGGTDYDGAEGAVGGSYTVHRQIWDVKPSDATAWVDTDINAAEFGYVKSA